MKTSKHTIPATFGAPRRIGLASKSKMLFDSLREAEAFKAKLGTGAYIVKVYDTSARANFRFQVRVRRTRV